MKFLLIDQENEGVRIDRILRKHLSSSTLSQIYRFLRKGAIRVNGKKVKQNYRLKIGDSIEANVPEAEPVQKKREVPSKVKSLVHTDFFRENFIPLYEDDDLLVCNKPVGLVVHSGTKHKKHDTLIDLTLSYVKHTSKKKECREPTLVHRLDKDTSGVILIAKNKGALRELHNAIRNHEIEKQYVALCHSKPREKKGTIDLSLKRTHERNRGMKVRIQQGGQRSLSTYRVIKSKNSLSLIEIRLHTGRTHQIRVHMSHISCPIVGDVRYGDHELDRLLFERHTVPQRLYLHAEHLSFKHPTLNRNIAFSAPVPPVFNTLLQKS